MSAPLLAVEGLMKQFVVRRSLLGAATTVVHAVDGVSFEIAAGETLALVGESGCGKSTVGRLVLRLIEPTSGIVRFNGQDLASLSSAALRRVRAGAQLIFQDPYGSLNPRMTVGEMLAEPLLLHTDLSPASRRERVAIRCGGLTARARKRYPPSFPAARQRLAMRARRRRAKLIVCDEPVLDVSVRSQILNLLKDLQRRRDLPTCSSATTWRWSSISPRAWPSCIWGASWRARRGMRSLPSRATLTRRPCYRRCRYHRPASGSIGACCRATPPARSILRTAVISTPAAPMRKTSAETRAPRWHPMAAMPQLAICGAT